MGSIQIQSDMRIWQADFYRRPWQNTAGQGLWELLICDATRKFEYQAICPQSQANSNWLISQIELAAGENLPDSIQVFRPQSLSLIGLAGTQLGISVEPTRRTFALKQWLEERIPQSLKPKRSLHRVVLSERFGNLIKGVILAPTFQYKNNAVLRDGIFSR